MNNHTHQSDTKPLLAVVFQEDLNKSYLLVDTIASGWFGSVMLVKDMVTGKRYARKLDLAPEIKTQHPQAAEVRLHKLHPNIPRLITHREYLHDATMEPGYDRQTSVAKVYTATTWQHCNGGDLGTMIGTHMAFNAQDAPLVWKLPDRFVWSLFETMLNVHMFITMTEPYIVHGDSHRDNWFLHWPEDEGNTSTYPQLMLGDFGNAQEWPDARSCKHPYLWNAWPDASADLSNRLNDRERETRRAWYELVRRDMSRTIRTLQEVLAEPYNTSRQQQQYAISFQQAARKSMSLHGYSPMLIKLIDQWSHVVTKPRIPSPSCQEWQDFKTELDRLRDMVHLQARHEAVCVKPSQNDLDMRNFRPVLPPNIPATWENVNHLLPIYRKDDGSGKVIRKEALLYLKDMLVLKPGQYRVVELETATQGVDRVKRYVSNP